MCKSPKNAPASAGITNQLSALQQRLNPIEYRSTDQLITYDQNPRHHPEKQIVKLMASISEFGMALPVLIDVGNVIIVGAGRLEAARRLGIKFVPVIVADQWSKAQIRAYRLADNKLAELSSWDDELLAIELEDIIELDEMPIDILGWETAEIDLIIDGGSGISDTVDPADEPVEPPAKPVTRVGDIWLMDKHRLLCGSSLETANWSQLMDGDTASMAFFDMPYNVPVTGHVCGLGKISHAEFAMASGEMSKAEFTAFLCEGIGAAAAHLKDGAIFDLCVDWRHVGEMLAAIEANDLTLLNLCIWNKTNGGMGSLYRSKYELIFIAKKGKAPHTNNVELGKHGRYRTNVWDYAGINSFGKTRMADLADHPTVKPVALVADAIRDVTKPNEIVIDGFMGSGSTILAAERTKRKCYGIEIDSGYIDVAIRRWTAMSGKQAVHAASGLTFAEVAADRASDCSNNEVATPTKI